MWAVIASGVVAVLTLLIKAVIDAGSRESRTRAAIVADIELLNSLPEGIAGAEELKRRVAVRLADFVRDPAAPQSEAAQILRTRDKARDRGFNFGLALVTAGVTFGVVNAIRLMNDDTSVDQPLASAVGVASIIVFAGMMSWSIVMTVRYRRRRRRRLSTVTQSRRRPAE